MIILSNAVIIFIFPITWPQIKHLNLTDRKNTCSTSGAIYGALKSLGHVFGMVQQRQMPNLIINMCH
jgi:hypothetical protein